MLIPPNTRIMEQHSPVDDSQSLMVAVDLATTYNAHGLDTAAVVAVHV